MEIPSVPNIRIKSVPESAFDALVRELALFQEGLSEETEVGIFANGASIPMHVESVRLSNQLVVFNGVDGEGRPACIIQHYTQISVQMIAVRKLENEPRRIGF